MASWHGQVMNASGSYRLRNLLLLVEPVQRLVSRAFRVPNHAGTDIGQRTAGSWGYEIPPSPNASVTRFRRTSGVTDSRASYRTHHGLSHRKNWDNR